MKHYTTNIEQRAWDCAMRFADSEAEKCLTSESRISTWWSVFNETFDSSLREFQLGVSKAMAGQLIGFDKAIELLEYLGYHVRDKQGITTEHARRAAKKIADKQFIDKDVTIPSIFAAIWEETKSHQ